MNIRKLQRPLLVVLAASLTLGGAFAESVTFDGMDAAPVVTVPPTEVSADVAAMFGLSTPEPTVAPVAPSLPSVDGAGVSGGAMFGTNTSPDLTNDTAAVGTGMYVVASTVKVRRSPNDRAGTIATCYFGEEVRMTGSQNDWAAIAVGKNNRTGYVKLSDLSESNPNIYQKQMYVQPKRIGFNKKPQRNGGRYRYLNMGETITMVAVSSDGKWARVTDGTNYGFVPTYALDDEPSKEGTVMWCGAGSTALMVNPDNWTRVGSLSLGQAVKVKGYIKDNTIAKICSDAGYVAYCATNALVATDPLSQSQQAYAQIGGAILYKSADENSKAGRIGKNARLTLLGTDSTGQWSVVKFGGRKYYVPAIYIDFTRPGNGYRTAVVTRDTQLIRAGGTDATGSVTEGTRVYVTGVSGANTCVITIPAEGGVQATGVLSFKDLKSE